MATDTDTDRARQSAQSQAETISDWYAICQFACEQITGADLTPEQKREMREIAGGSWDGESFDDLRDDLQTRVSEDPLSVEVRSDWHTPGWDSGATEYAILLSTGGPACRIIGDLDSYGQPCSATLQFQDWYQPWQDSPSADYDEDALIWYAQQFYYGEG
jgi:hypothetical protein